MAQTIIAILLIVTVATAFQLRPPVSHSQPRRTKSSWRQLPQPPHIKFHLNMSMKDDNGDTNGSSNNDSDIKTRSKSTSSVKLFELDNAFEDDGTNVVGSKFFGGTAVKEELYIPEEEERALELQNARVLETEYRRFDDTEAFVDEMGREIGMAYQLAINNILYRDGDDQGRLAMKWMEDDKIIWETSIEAKNASPLRELESSMSFYKKLDLAIIAGQTVKASDDLYEVQVRWDLGGVWPNFWEARFILTGTSLLTVKVVDGKNFVLLKQVDTLDGSNPGDVVGTLSKQLPPRFWDFYHIGMTPSAEIDPRFTHLSSDSLANYSSQKVSGKKGLLSGYKVSYLSPRLMTEPSLIDTNGRDARLAQCLPDHAFTTAIKTMGPNKEEFVPVSPIEIVISKAEGEDGSLIKWSVPVPPEFASKLVLPLPSIEDDEEEIDDANEEESNDGLATTNDTTMSLLGRTLAPRPNPPTSLKCNYSLRPSRLVATLQYAGNPQDEEVTQLRRQLYQEVVERDGFTPKLDPVTNRPIFFFWMNDAKACFTRDGGLGMAVYEWRADWANANEVGIELEF